MCKFRTLRADEIEVRVQQIGASSTGVYAHLLLYKDARVDMNMLDEHFGIFGWQREHIFREGRNYCRLSVKSDNGEWIVKEDVGTESNTEATKGEASDAFKRACVNLGIGRELYTAPKIVIKLTDKDYYESGKDKNGKPIYKLSNWVKFKVGFIAYTEMRSISSITIVDQNGYNRFTA